LDEIEPFGLLCDGYAQFNAVTIAGYLSLISVSTAGILSIESVQVGDSLLLGRFDSVPSRIGSVSLLATAVVGGTDVDNCLVGRFHVGQSRLSGLSLGGRHGQMSPLGHGVVLKELELFESAVSGGVRCQGIQVMGTLRVERCQLKQFDLDGRLGPKTELDHGLEPRFRPRLSATNLDAERRFILPTRIQEGIEMRSNQIDGNIQLLGCRITRKAEEVQPALEISASIIGRHLTFWTGRYCEKVNVFSVAEQFQSVPKIDAFREAGLAYDVHGILSRHLLPGWSISGEDKKAGTDPNALKRTSPHLLGRADQIRLERRRTAARVTTQVDGRVRVNQSRLGGDVRLSNLHAPRRYVELIELRVAGNVRADNEDARYENLKGQDEIGPAVDEGVNPRTSCGILTIKQCRIEGRVDLTGLDAGATTKDVSLSEVDVEDRPDIPAALSITDSSVAEIVSLVDPETAERSEEGHEKPTARAALRGRMDISGSTFGTLRLSGQLWPPPAPTSRSEGVKHLFRALTQPDDTQREPDPLIRGEGTTIEKLEFVYSLPRDDFRGGPAIDLPDTRVKTWSLDRWRRKTIDLGTFVVKFLRKTKPSGRLYHQIESFLNGVGHEDWARKVRRDFIWRQRCVALCDVLPNRTTVKRILRRRRMITTGDESPLRRIGKIAWVCLLAVAALFVLAFRPRALPARPPKGVPRAGVAGTIMRSASWLRARTPYFRLPVWLLAWTPLLVFFFAPKHRNLAAPSALLMLLPFLLYPEARKCAVLLGSVVNRIFSGNFTSPARATFLWVMLYGFSTLFFWDVHHLDINAMYKNNFFEDAALSRPPRAEGVAVAAVAAPGTADRDAAALACTSTPPRVAKEEVRLLSPGGRPTQVTLDVCETLGQWDWKHAALIATRFMVPVAPSMYDEIDIDNTFGDEPQSDGAFSCKTVAERSLLGRCCAVSEPWLQHAGAGNATPWVPAKDREFTFFHDWNASFVALVIRVLSSVLLTLLGATIASQLSRRPSSS
ncbi:MAG TPA: hypothetical protein VNO55_13630, partial [Polyangia bacterium]|nr:hypothetical protein [Polyangia bacterium]